MRADLVVPDYKNRQEAIAYLGIGPELFDFYDSKSYIIYSLIGFERMYSMVNLDRFKTEVLEKRKR